MSVSLIFTSVGFSLFVIGFILFLLKKEKITIKYSLIWILLFSILLIALLIPGFMSFITEHLGFKTPSNMVLSLLIATSVLLNIVLTMIVSNQDKKIRLLFQEVSILIEKVKRE